jgi:hypothetical protein
MFKTLYNQLSAIKKIVLQNFWTTSVHTDAHPSLLKHISQYEQHHAGSRTFLQNAGINLESHIIKTQIII